MLTVILLALCAALAFGQASDTAAEARTIDATKKAVVREMDRTLPQVPLARWLGTMVSNEETAWEVNDCGEQTGNPLNDRNRDLPLCVQVDSAVGTNRLVNVRFVVGSFKRGPTPGPPRFLDGTYVERGIPTKWVTRLRDLPVFVEAVKQEEGTLSLTKKTFCRAEPRQRVG